MQNYQSSETHATLGEVLGEKIVAWVRLNKASRLFRKGLELIAGVFLGGLVIAPAQVAGGFMNLLKMNDFVVLKVTVILTVFFGRRAIIRLFRRCSKHVQNLSRGEDEKLLDAVPVPELVDYLMRNKHFKREGINGVRATFGLNMERYNRLAQKLEENGVLTRGENNSRILSDRWSRQSLIDYMSGVEHSKDLEPRFRITRIGPNAKIRLDRNEFEPAPAR